MAHTARTIGIIGGSGMLGSAISNALLQGDAREHLNLWVANRSGNVPDVAGANITVTRNNQDLVDACETIILCVPPASFPEIDINASDSLVISVMAGVTMDAIKSATGARRVARAMSSPAASFGLAYSPWVASAGLTSADRNLVNAVLGVLGTTDEIFDEQQMDHFTAMIGPVPGFVAYFAKCMVDHATAQGISAEVAERAIRQLFLAGGRMLAEGDASPDEHVREMIDYAGTTAAGLMAMIDSDLCRNVSDGLLAAANKAKTM